ncbi:phage integrase N-terminal domain-containing protein, partial [Escherichia coli]
MGMLEREMKNLARQAGGSHKTVHDRIAMAGRFCERLMELNVQIRYVHHLKAKHIEAYIQMRLAQGIQKNTLHNETAANDGEIRQTTFLDNLPAVTVYNSA